jgi:Family of unknown function (DUF5985)
MIESLSGAVTVGFIVAAALFLHLGRGGGGDRLFLALGSALALLAVNQILTIWLGDEYEHIAYVYLLRVIGFVLVLAALIEKTIWKQSS